MGLWWLVWVCFVASLDFGRGFSDCCFIVAFMRVVAVCLVRGCWMLVGFVLLSLFCYGCFAGWVGFVDVVCCLLVCGFAGMI